MNLKTEQKVIQLLKNYSTNCDKLKRLIEDDTIKEWTMDYHARESSGGLQAMKAEGASHSTGTTSMQEKLFLEQEKIIHKIEQMKAEINLVKLMFLELDEASVDLLRYRFKDRMTVYEITDLLFISRSTYYRRLRKIILAMGRKYDEIVGK